MAAAIEAELKLRAEDDQPLEELVTARSLGRAELGPPATADELDIYLDSPDGRLAAARWACRLRWREGRRWISLKGPAAHRPGETLHRRPEVEGAVGDDPMQPASWPDSPARRMVLDLAGDHRLVELVALRQRRTERAVMLDGDRIGILSLDRVVVLLHGASIGQLFVVELELDDPESTAVASELLQALASRDGLSPDPGSKLERALRLAAAASRDS